LNSALLNPILFLISVVLFATLVCKLAIFLWPAKNLDLIWTKVTSWWAIIIIFSTGILLGELGIKALFVILSIFMLKEFLVLLNTRERIQNLLMLAALPTLYFFKNDFIFTLFFSSILIFAVLFLSSKRPRDYFLKGNWGIFVAFAACIFCFNFPVLLFEQITTLSVPLLIIYLVFLTEINDVFQFLIGTKWGKLKIAPIISPEKTLEGLLGGVLLTPVAAIILGNIWGLFSFQEALLLGMGISLLGYCGDLFISAVKRHSRVKDTGCLIPGHGGLLDRLDSLIFTAPFFYHFVIVIKEQI